MSQADDYKKFRNIFRAVYMSDVPDDQVYKVVDKLNEEKSVHEYPTPEQIEAARKSICESEDERILSLMTEENESEDERIISLMTEENTDIINLSVDKEIEYISNTIRNALGVNLIGQGDLALAEENYIKQFKEDKEFLHSFFYQKVKEHLEEKGIDTSILEIKIKQLEVSFGADSFEIESDKKL